MAKVSKRKLPSGLIRWQASYVDGAGKRRAKLFDRKSDGEVWLCASKSFNSSSFKPVIQWVSTGRTVLDAGWSCHIRARTERDLQLRGLHDSSSGASPQLGGNFLSGKPSSH